MPIDPNYDKTGAAPSYPENIPDLIRYLKRETRSTPDQNASQARTTNVILLELLRLMEVLGPIPGWAEGDTYIGQIDNLIFGDGSDGDFTYTGSGTVSQDQYYEDLTIAAGNDFETNGYRIFVRGTLTIEANATIINNGADGSATTGGGGTDEGSLGGSGDGGDDDTAGAGTTNSLGGNGGDGGGSGGAGGTAASAQSGLGLNDFAMATQLFDSEGKIEGGAGGGGGETVSGDAGGGGGGGGVVMIAANRIVTAASGRIAANGGDGADGAGSSAAGGGGGGGVVVVVTKSISDDSILRAQGGSGGTGSGGNGDPGGNGITNIALLTGAS